MSTSKLKKSNLTILYVEDEDLIRKEIANILSYVAENIILAKDGEEGLEAFNKNKVDLIITDVNMPKLSGFEMLKKIREVDSSIPAIILSAFSQAEFIKEANEIATINSYLLKPVDIMTLLEKVKISIEKVEKTKEFENITKLLEQYKLAVDSSAIVSKANSSGIITYVNEQFCKISKYSKDELLGKNHNIVRHEDNKELFFKDLWETIKIKKKIWKGKIKNRAKDGTSYIVDVTIVPILNIKQEIEEFIALRYDITELEAYKDLLKEKLSSSREDVISKIHLIKEYENMINISASVLRVDINHEVSFINNRLLTLLGYKFEEIIGIKFLDLLSTDSQLLYKTIFANVLEKEFWNGTLQFDSKDKENQFSFDFTFRSIKDINGNIKEFMAIGKNITETIQLYKEIEDTQKDVIFSLGTIGEARSKETGNHVKRVALYSHLLAKLIGFDDEEAELIKIASPMHDIGKVAIEDAILNKPGRFTIDEYELMQKHSTIGYNMLKNSNREILKASATIAHEHHEKYDGTGYPRGLKAEQIHIYGRITALADVFDALGSNRVYKKAWSLEQILEFFQEEKGKHFDPKLVTCFFDNLDDFLAIQNRYKD